MLWSEGAAVPDEVAEQAGDLLFAVSVPTRCLPFPPTASDLKMVPLITEGSNGGTSAFCGSGRSSTLSHELHNAALTIIFNDFENASIY